MTVRPFKAPSPVAADLDLQVGESLQVQFMDDETRGQFYVKVIGFLPERSVLVTTPEKDGRPLKSLERPGLWNGGMARWNTLFVEVPLSTFNPVKTVNALLLPAHQPRTSP